ncbi:DUF3139 domain-containing protein [Bacillus marasmi]|uniref:DUF3139 domain-containing protein n=1 Tax=Bacillus marasmi TaxID=1926279 RepID=UPI0011CA3D67|nr:DUF3139 domain-containing protein [Bacillus marasmi]
MTKWINGILICVLVFIPIGGFYWLNYGNPIDKFIANRYVPKYLKNNGYSNDEILEAHYVDPKNLINKDFYHGHYLVRFQDEPEMNYYYGILKKSKKVKQFCERDWNGATGVEPVDYYDKRNKSKHLEKDCVNSLDNRE